MFVNTILFSSFFTTIIILLTHYYYIIELYILTLKLLFNFFISYFIYIYLFILKFTAFTYFYIVFLNYRNLRKKKSVVFDYNTINKYINNAGKIMKMTNNKNNIQ